MQCLHVHDLAAIDLHDHELGREPPHAFDRSDQPKPRLLRPHLPQAYNGWLQPYQFGIGLRIGFGFEIGFEIGFGLRLGLEFGTSFGVRTNIGFGFGMRTCPVSRYSADAVAVQMQRSMRTSMRATASG